MKVCHSLVETQHEASHFIPEFGKAQTSPSVRSRSISPFNFSLSDFFFPEEAIVYATSSNLRSRSKSHPGSLSTLRAKYRSEG